MECEICMENFDHSKHEPYVLIPCSHTFCISCINKLANHTCPTCKRNFLDTNPNWIMFKIVQKSNYDKMKQTLFDDINEINSLKFKFKANKEKKVLENTVRLRTLREEINSKTNEIINSLLVKREKLLSETIYIEDYLNKSLDQIEVNTIISETKKELEKNELEEVQLVRLSDSVSSCRLDLESKIDLIEQFSNEYMFVTKDSSQNYNIGEITNKNWKFSENSESDLINKGDLLSKQLKDYNKAIEYFDQAIKLNSSSVEANYKKANALGETKNYNAAIRYFNKAIELDSSYAKAYSGKGTALTEKKQYEAAILCFDKAIQIDPLFKMAYNGKGIALKELRDFKKALECFNKAIHIDSNYSNAYFNKGNILREMNDFKSAVDCYNKSIELDPNDVTAFNNKVISVKQLQELTKKI